MKYSDFIKNASLYKQADPTGKGLNSEYYRKNGIDPALHGQFLYKERGPRSLSFLENRNAYSLATDPGSKSDGQYWSCRTPDGKRYNAYLRTTGTPNFAIDVSDRELTYDEVADLAKKMKPIYSKAGVTEDQFIRETLGHNRMHFATSSVLGALKNPAGYAIGTIGKFLKRNTEKNPTAIADMRALTKFGPADYAQEYLAYSAKPWNSTPPIYPIP